MSDGGERLARIRLCGYKMLRMDASEYGCISCTMVVVRDRLDVGLATHVLVHIPLPATRHLIRRWGHSDSSEACYVIRCFIALSIVDVFHETSAEDCSYISPSLPLTSLSQEQMAPPQHVTILGAGLSGLTAAYRLSGSCPGTRVTLLDSADRTGGWIRSTRYEVRNGEEEGEVYLESGPRSIRPKGSPGAAGMLRLVSRRWTAGGWVGGGQKC